MKCKQPVKCSLCSAEAGHLTCFREKDYYRCTNCLSVMMDPLNHLSPQEEKKRYDEHNNDVNDSGYRGFVKPLVDTVLSKFDLSAAGLDYGAGSGPVASAILKEKGYRIYPYDPFYWNNKALLKLSYNYIICCEVIEHFANPAKEFKLLRSLLKPGGSLICMTEILSSSLDFEQWYYKNDPTHVFFYHPNALAWIKETHHFTSLGLNDRVIHFQT